MAKENSIAPDNRYPENIRQMIALTAAVIRRIRQKRLDNAADESLCMTSLKGGSPT